MCTVYKKGIEFIFIFEDDNTSIDVLMIFDGDDFSFSHHSTFFHPGSKKRLKKFTVDGPYGAWGVVSIRTVKPVSNRLLGFITLVLEIKKQQ